MQKHHKRQEFSSEQIFFVCYSGFASSLLKYKKFFRGRKVPSWINRIFISVFHFLKYKKSFFWENIKTFLCKNFLSLRLESSIFLNIGKFFKVDFFELGKFPPKKFFLRKYKNFFNLRVKRFHFLNFKNFFGGVVFFSFFELWLKSVPGGSIIYF